MNYSLFLFCTLTYFTLLPCSLIDENFGEPNPKKDRISFQINHNNFRDDEEREKEWGKLVETLGNGDLNRVRLFSLV